VIVTDHPVGVAALRATQTFRVVVRDTRPDFVLSFGSTNLFAGESGSVPLNLLSGLDLTNVSFFLDLTSAGLLNLTLSPTAGSVGAATLGPAGPERYVVRLAASAGEVLQGAGEFARLAFDTSTNGPSALVSLRPREVTGLRSTGETVIHAGADQGRVIVVNRQPVLTVDRGWPLRLSLYGRIGVAYTLECRTNLPAGGWTDLGSFSLTNIGLTLDLPDARPPVFYRARETGP
jgi:hypothetical protein